jgi:DNA modification methylase
MSNTLIVNADSRHIPLPDDSVQLIITSPPYFSLRQYLPDTKGEIGQQTDLKDYITSLVEVFRECRRILRADGQLLVNIDDTYSGSGYAGTTNNMSVKAKCLLGVPWVLAFALRDDGWYLRLDSIWATGLSGQQELKSQLYWAMISEGIAPEKIRRIMNWVSFDHGSNLPNSQKDRPTRSHEYVFMFTKSADYFYNYDDSLEPALGEGKRKASRGRKLTSVHLQNDGWPIRQGTAGPKQAKIGQNQGKTTLGLKYERRNRRSVWYLQPEPFSAGKYWDDDIDHYAAYPVGLAEFMITAGSTEGDWVFDPFCGSGTSLIAAARLNRHAIGIDLNHDYCRLMKARVKKDMETIIEKVEKKAVETGQDALF